MNGLDCWRDTKRSNREGLIYWYYGKHKNHPSEKSVDIARQLVRWCSDKGMLILDPFCGSGTTLIACELEERRSIGIDKEDEYVQIAKNRLITLQSQTCFMKIPPEATP